MPGHYGKKKGSMKKGGAKKAAGKLTAGQKKLPMTLQKKIMAKRKK